MVLAAPHVHNGDDLGAVGLRGGSELVVWVLAAPHVHNGDDLGAVGLRGGSEL